MTDAKSLRESIAQYKVQLAQVDATLSSMTNGPDKENLLSLKSDIEELIELTTESLQSLEGSHTESQDKIEDFDSDDDDPLSKEYALFKAELNESSDDSKNTEQVDTAAGSSNDIKEELKQLEGMKCRAPHGSSWGGNGYHNAMVCSVYKSNDIELKTIQDIKVRVLFINPTHKEMLPCPYFLNGKCKFSDEQCRFSHGEIVPLLTLQEYSEPDFQSIKMGSRVLAKQKNKLWYKCVVLKLPEEPGGDFRVKFEATGDIAEISLQDLLPLDDADLEMSDTSNDSDCENNVTECDTKELIHRSLLTVQPDEPLGNWEKHTRGMGSKLMAQMGYVIGTGLGKRSDGRIEPVEATVLPSGKSLDHCMELRENAGGDKNLFTVERRMHKERRKLEQQREKQYEKEKLREKSDIFNFINATLNDKTKRDNAASSSKCKDNLKAETNLNLSVANFQVGRNITRLEREASKLKGSLTRHSKGSIYYNNIVMQYNEKQKELTDLRMHEKNIIAEQNQRKNKGRLSIF